MAQQVGTAKQERTPARRTQHNGYGEGSWATRAGEIPSCILKSLQSKFTPPAVALAAVAPALRAPARRGRSWQRAVKRAP